MHYARVGTLVKPTVPLRTFVFVLGALIYFAIFAELVLLVYLLETTAYSVAHRLLMSGLFRTLGEEGRLPLSHPLTQSSGCQGSRPQQVEVCPPVSLPLDELELMYEALHGSGAPALR